MARRAELVPSSTGAVPAGTGWFVLNARDARWNHAPGRSAVCDFEGEVPFEQIGVNISVLNPGEAMSQYHWEVDQEDFLVLAGEALLVIEGEEHPLRAWDFVHCPPGVSHVILGAGERQCLVFAVGAREQTEDNWGAYPVDPVAVSHGAGVEQETSDPSEAYAGLSQRRPTTFDPAWLPD